MRYMSYSHRIASSFAMAAIKERLANEVVIVCKARISATKLILHSIYTRIRSAF